MIIAWLLFSITASAKPEFFNELSGKVGKEPVTRCKTCHSATGNPKALNAFGKDFRKTVLDPIDPDIEKLSRDERWDVLFSMDSNGNGITNRQDIDEDRNPGEKEVPAVVEACVRTVKRARVRRSVLE